MTKDSYIIYHILYSDVTNICLVLYELYYNIHEDDQKRPKHVICIVNKIVRLTDI
jgi:hypothetical protein